MPGEPGPQGPPGNPVLGDAGPPGPPGSDGVTPLFAGPGLELSIDSVELDGAEARVDYTLTDLDGRPLDQAGLSTEGAVTVSFILSWLDENTAGESKQYTTYTLRDQTSPDTNVTATQSATDTGGVTTSLGNGRYRYVFGSEIDTAGKTDKTHTVGVYATREFRGLRYVANTTHSFVPNGDDVTTTLDVVSDQACANCHGGPIEGHGGARRGVLMCSLCHTPDNSIDPDTGNTFDFQVMIHKIHRGANLPSVQAGEPYQIVGFRQSVHDYSEVHYPGEVANCNGCHAGSQGDRWETRLSVRTCSSCHDRIHYTDTNVPDGFTMHPGGPHDDSECLVCHTDDSISPVWERHMVPFTNPSAPEFAIELESITNTGPGELPEVRFSVTLDASPVDVLTDPPDRLRMLIAGPNSDYDGYFQEEVLDAGACGSPAEPPCLEAVGSSYIYHAETPIPDDARGSYTVGMEGRVIIDDVRWTAHNPTLAFSVTDEAPVARREVVTQEQCESCHQDLSFHGGNRRDVQYCTMCHTANLVAGEVLEGQSGVLARAGNFKDLIHAVHAEAHYPDTLANCAHCHAAGTTTLPLATDLRPSRSELLDCVQDAGVDEDDECQSEDVSIAAVFLTPPESAACLSCHSAPATAVHAEVNTSTTTSAESCATCHGPGSSVDIDVAHELDP